MPAIPQQRSSDLLLCHPSLPAPIVPAPHPVRCVCAQLQHRHGSHQVHQMTSHLASSQSSPTSPNLKLESCTVWKYFLCGLPRHWALLDCCLLAPSQFPFHDIPSFLPDSQLLGDSLVLTWFLSFFHLLLWVVFFSPLNETPRMCFWFSNLTLLLASRFLCPFVSTPLLGSLTHSVSRKKFASVSLFCS